MKFSWKREQEEHDEDGDGDEDREFLPPKKRRELQKTSDLDDEMNEIPWNTNIIKYNTLAYAYTVYEYQYVSIVVYEYVSVCILSHSYVYVTIEQKTIVAKSFIHRHLTTILIIGVIIHMTCLCAFRSSTRGHSIFH